MYTYTYTQKQTRKTRPSNTCSASCSAPGTTDQASSPSITQKIRWLETSKRHAFSGAAKEIAASQKWLRFGSSKKNQGPTGPKGDIEGRY